LHIGCEAARIASGSLRVLRQRRAYWDEVPRNGFTGGYAATTLGFIEPLQEPLQKTIQEPLREALQNQRHWILRSPFGLAERLKSTTRLF